MFVDRIQIHQVSAPFRKTGGRHYSQIQSAQDIQEGQRRWKTKSKQNNFGAILLDNALVTPAAGRTNLVGANSLDFKIIC